MPLRLSLPGRRRDQARVQGDGRLALWQYHRRSSSRVPPGSRRARQLGADHVVDFTRGDVVGEIMRLTDGRGVDVAIEALGRQETFEAALRVLRPGGTLSSLGVYSSDLKIPLDAFMAGGRQSRPDRWVS
jgi:threonine dehydrogenase-like Zn-dependent dehydrogenase